MRRELCILAAALLLLTGCSSQKAESPAVQPGTGVTEDVKAETTTSVIIETELETESESVSKAAVEAKSESDSSDKSAPSAAQEWPGTYESHDGQTIVITVGKGDYLHVEFKGYSEEGWYTDAYDLNYTNEERTEALRPQVEGQSEEELYTLTEKGLTVQTNPAGAWKDGNYIRK